MFYILLICFSINALASDKPLQQYFLEFPPYWQSDKEGEYSGLHYHLAQKLFEHAGIRVKFSLIPYTRMQMQVKHGLIPFINYGEVEGVVTEDILHICVPPTKINLRIYYLNAEQPEINIPADFEGKYVVIMRGHPLGDFEHLKDNKKINFIKASSVEAALKILSIGRADYLIAFDNLLKEPLKSSHLVESFHSQHLYSLLGYPITTPKSYPNGEQLCDKVLKSYFQLVEEGMIDEESGLLISTNNQKVDN